MSSSTSSPAPGGVPLSRLVFGGNVLGWTVDEATSFALLDRLVDAGLTTIDSADMYSAWAPGHQGGESEATLGAWLRARGPGMRQRVQLMTKVGKSAPVNPPPGQGLSPAYIERAIDASLKRLGTDHVDVYFSHAFDAQVPQADTLGAYQRLLRAGKLRAIGASNFSAPQLRAALDTAAAHGLPAYQVLQPHYNLIDRGGYDGPLRELAMQQGLAVVPYFSLASGFLTGKYRSAADLAGSARGGWVKNYLNPRGLRILAALDEVAAQHRAQPGEVALAWLMARPGVTAPIASATSVAQLESLIRATQLGLSAADIAALDAASAPDPQA
ncbi:MAG: aldo/keto reductase [Proteobacteria bacterium]|nr:aldo/keto reductase [Pseudomonadota bacterium]